MVFLHPADPRWRTTRRRVGDALLSGLVAISGRLPTDGVIPSWDSQVFAVNVLAAVLLLFRRRWAVPVLAGTVALAWVAVGLDAFGPGLALAAAVATYGVAVERSRRQAVVATAVTAVALWTAGLVAGQGGAQFELVVLLGGAIGDAIRSQRANVRTIEERAERAERTRDALARQRVAEDRLAIARDLHDAVAHQIAVINLHAGRASSAMRARPDDAEQSLATIRAASRTVLTEIGDLLSTLRDPHALDTEPPGLGLLDDAVREFTVHGLEVRLRTEGPPRELPAAVDVVALRTIQEALTNVHKHGSGHRADVTIGYSPDRVTIAVENPAPAPAATDDVATGYGLTGMRERIDSVRGALTSGPTAHGTWLLVADLPAVSAGAVENPVPANGGSR